MTASLSSTGRSRDGCWHGAGQARSTHPQRPGRAAVTQQCQPLTPPCSARSFPAWPHLLHHRRAGRTCARPPAQERKQSGQCQRAYQAWPARSPGRKARQEQRGGAGGVLAQHSHFCDSSTLPSADRSTETSASADVPRGCPRPLSHQPLKISPPDCLYWLLTIF